MSVLIKGMEMPKNCSDCRFYFSAFMTNPRTMKCDKYCLFDAEENCPLVEIPKSHGRLIDADELLKHLADDGREAFTKSQVWLMFSEYGAPTVIESEG